MAMNRIDHATVRVKDIGQSLEWYGGVLGLEVLDRSSSRAHIACRGTAVDVTLVSGGQSIEDFAFGVDHRDDLERVERSLKEHGAAFERRRPADRPGTAELTRFTLPSGHVMEMSIGSAGRVAGKTDTVSDGTYRPTDIDHVNLLGEIDPQRFSEFMMTVLGFRQSLALTIGEQWVGSWLRSTARDHDIAYMQAIRPSDRLHHVAFAVEDGNHYCRISDRLIETGHHWEFGPGRHKCAGRDTTGFGTNLFAYAFDPTGNRNEFSSGMNYFPDDASAVLKIRPDQMGEMMNGWANNMPESFMTQGS